jgi:hypothetical protein
MPETPETSADPPSDSGLNDIAALLAEQIAASHAAAARCFSVAADEEDFQPAQREDALRVASRLMHACAAAANAIKRIKGEGFDYHITVERVDVAAEKAARKARAEKARTAHSDRRAEIERKIAKIIGIDFQTPPAPKKVP